MQLLMRIIVPVLALPVFLAFQIASPVHVLCGFGSCILTPDKLAPVACVMECITAKPDPEPTGCCAMARETARTSNGCDRSCAADCSAKPPCLPSTPLSVECSIPAKNCGDGGEQPWCKRRPCRACVAERYVTEPAVEISSREFPTPVYPVSGATLAQAMIDREQSRIHTHSPPLAIPAHAGADVCLEKCSFLL